MEQWLPGLFALQNIHPMLVHFPIALLLSALAMEALAVLMKDERFHFVATWILYLGTVAAVITVPTGFMAMNQVASAVDSGSHNAPGHDFIHIHRDWMVATTSLAVFLSAYLFWINRKKRWASQRRQFLVGLALLSVLLVLGADRGARLVFEFGTGVNPRAFEATPQTKNHEDAH